MSSNVESTADEIICLIEERAKDKGLARQTFKHDLMAILIRRWPQPMMYHTAQGFTDKHYDRTYNHGGKEEDRS